jgi:hypothetical protein
MPKQKCRDCVYIQDIPEKLRNQLPDKNMTGVGYCDKCKVLVILKDEICACFRKKSEDRDGI